MPRHGRGLLVSRRRLLCAAFVLAAVGLSTRTAFLQLAAKDWLQAKGAERYERSVELVARRGMIADRHGEPLAISTPVTSIGAVPTPLLRARRQWPGLLRVLSMNERQLEALLVPRLVPRRKREFVFLARQVTPAVAEAVQALGIEGVTLRLEQRRYYPVSEVTAHVTGFTDLDERGQEGMELAFDHSLRGHPGANRVIRDRVGRTVEQVEHVRSARPGEALRLTIDKRLQHVTYRELKMAVRACRARAGSAVMLDARNGEILALVNQPSYNPNKRYKHQDASYRNRVVTDVFEPGSTIKPFTLAAALESGLYDMESRVDTRPGTFTVGRHTVRDIHPYGVLDLRGVLAKSSNVGVAKIALSLEPRSLWVLLRSLGFGSLPGTGFPGESPGYLNHFERWRPIDQATLAYGYGLSVSTLQLARAYLTFANDGRLLPVRLHLGDTAPLATPVMAEKTAHTLTAMLERAVTEGTGGQARVPGYRVAGKTGTARKTKAGGGYARDRYLALFAGMIPASDPRLVMVVAIDEPRGTKYYGGEVAAPVFARVMREAVRLLDIPPDALEPGHAPLMQHLAAQVAGSRPVAP
ncbi:MAG: peptidoglycan D,D-transpeptidase FtsI family protein [Gammaproteobacteria bacterium]